MKERMIAESKKPSAMPRAGRGPAKAATPSALPDWITQINPEVFARHLHAASNASWKDAKGLHFDQWID